MKGCCRGKGGGSRGHTLTEHWDATLQCHRLWQPQAPTRLSSFWLLYSRNRLRITSFSDPAPSQAPFPSSHLVITAQSHFQVRAQLSQTCGRKKTCSADHFAGSLCHPNGIASYRAKLIAGPAGKTLSQDPPDHATVMAAALPCYDYINFWVSSYNCDKFLHIK